MIAKNMAYEEMPLSKSKKKDLMVFSEMTTSKIIRKLSYRHRVGLWASGTVTGWALFLHVPHLLVVAYQVFFN